MSCTGIAMKYRHAPKWIQGDAKAVLHCCGCYCQAILTASYFLNYLYRYHHISIDNRGLEKWKLGAVSTGTPQGCVLSPLLVATTCMIFLWAEFPPLLQPIHSSIFYDLLSCSQVRKGAEAYPSYFMVKAGYTLDMSLV